MPFPRPSEPGAVQVGSWCVEALRMELELTPKPGLVDRRNRGAHRDMDLGSFQASLRALAPWFPRFHRAGAATADRGPEALLPALRPPGLAAEGAMFEATGGVNTHKGGLFSLGLLSGAAGRLSGTSLPDREALCREAARACATLVAAELEGNPRPRTAGERLYRAHGLTGVRGEAAGGFRTVRETALPAWDEALARGADEETALLHALLHLLAVNPDTNLVNRGGLDALAHVQARARDLLAVGGALAPGARGALEAFDDDLVARNLSPGGSADLLAVAAFLRHFP